MKKVGERVRHARQLANLTQEQLAKACGVTRVAVTRWETNVSLPEKNYKQIADSCRVNLGWLMTGQGSARVGRTASLSQTLQVDQAKRLEDLAATLDATRKELESIRTAEIEHREIPQMQKLPVVGKIAANHVPSFSEAKETQLVDVRFSRDKHYCLQVKGRSMHPTIYEGDVVVVEHIQMNLEPYDEMNGPANKECWKRLHKQIVCAIVDDEEPILKRVRISDRKDTGFKITLCGDNPAAEQIEVERETRLRIVGIIRSIMRDPLNFD
jgi:SOS-response transcriptional repressor LexA